MQRDILLILIGGVIALVSSVVTALLQNCLKARKQRQQWGRDDSLRRRAELLGDQSEIRALRRSLESQALAEAKKTGYFLAESGGAGAEEWQRRGFARAVAWVPLIIAVVLCTAILAVVIYFGLLPLLRLVVTLPAWVLVLAAVILINVAAIVLLRLWVRHRKVQRIIDRLVELHPGIDDYLYTRRGPVKRRCS